MILYIMLVVLGFFLASLAFVLVAPSFWNRAVRLTRKRIESTMPLSLAEIEADKDQLRAEFAVKIRRLEAALDKAKEKSAHQLVEISRLQMAITELKDQIATLERSLDERRNAAAVFELTIKKRLPELEEALAVAQGMLSQRAYEVADLNNKIRRREEALATAQRQAGLQQAEIARLRDAMEKSSAAKAMRFKKRPSQWTLDEYRAEYDRLNVELSKLREQVSAAYDRESNQIAFLKAELQQLAEHVMAAATPSPAPQPVAAETKPAEAPADPAAKPAPQPRPTTPLPPRRSSPADRRFSRPEPWPKAAEPVEAEPVERPKIIRRGEAVRPGRSAEPNLEDLANKSLEEVLEAALPLTGEVVIVREADSNTPPAPSAERKAARHSINAPILSEAKPEASVERSRPEAADALVRGLAERMEVVTSLPQGREKLAPPSWRVADADASPAPVEARQPEAPKPEAPANAGKEASDLFKTAFPPAREAPGEAAVKGTAPDAHGMPPAGMAPSKPQISPAEKPAPAEKSAMIGNEASAAPANGSVKEPPAAARPSEAEGKPATAAGGEAQIENEESAEVQGKKRSLLERLRVMKDSKAQPGEKEKAASEEISR